MEYQQPQFYQFNEDSIYLVEYVSGLGLRPKSILDIGCGCGVLAIEYIKKLNYQISHVGLIELQEEFRPYIENNFSIMLPHLNYNLSIRKLSINEDEQVFDLVLSNPPYFKEGAGRVSSSKNRQLCRTFQDNNILEWVEYSLSFLAKMGVMFFLCHKSNKDIKELLKKSYVSIVDEKKEVLVLKAFKE